MVRIYSPLDQFLQTYLVISNESKPMSNKKKTTHRHSKLIINEQLGHQTEKRVVVLSAVDRFERDACEDGFEARREFSFLFE